METRGKIKKQVFECLNVLLVGNNPIELSRVFDSVKMIPGKRIFTEIAFDLKTILERLVKFRPNYILIDDNIGKLELKTTVKKLCSDKRTKNIPIAILKNSNYQEVVSVGVMDYLLKEMVTGKSLYTALSNSLKFRRTQRYLYRVFKKRSAKTFDKPF